MEYSSVCEACCDRSGARNANWKGGKTYHKNGYVMCRIDGKYVFEHVLVMEKKLGRHLLPNENVHHKNGVKDDNRRRNLELWVRPHPAGQRSTDLVKWAKEILRLYLPL